MLLVIMPIKVGGLYLLIRTDFHRLNEYIYKIGRSSNLYNWHIRDYLGGNNFLYHLFLYFLHYKIFSIITSFK